MSLFTTKLLDYGDLIAKKILLHISYLAHFIMQIEKEFARTVQHENKTLPVETVAIRFDGLSIILVINPDYWNSLDTNRRRIACIMHHIVHIIYKHPLYFQPHYHDKQIYDIAADIVVNQAIGQHNANSISDCDAILEDTATLEQFKMLGLRPKESTEYYYKELEKVMQSMQNKEQNNQPLNDGEKALKDMMQKMQGDSDSDSDGENKSDGTGDSDSNGEGSDGNKPSNKSGKPGNKSMWLKPGNEQMQELLESSIDDRIVDTDNRSRGTKPGYFTDLVEIIAKSREPVFDWRQVLKKFTNNSNMTFIKTTMKRESKRFGVNPGLKLKRRNKIFVALDTSGSVNYSDMEEFFGEMNNIWRTNPDILVAECDAALGNVYTYNGHPPAELSGRGGTDFQPPMDYILEGNYAPDCIIYFTDGYCCPPARYPSKPILWIVCSNGADINRMDKFPGTVIKMAPTTK